MRVCVIGYDALEYDLVEKYKLSHLRQKEYGRVEINTGMLSTPTIWTSFITGLLPSGHGVKGLRWENATLEKFRQLIINIKLNRIYERSRFLLKTVGKGLDHVGINTRFPSVKGRVPTIFDYAQHPIDISVPCYSNVSKLEELSHELAKRLGNPIGEKHVLRKAWEMFREKKRECLDKLGNDWDLFMVHFWLADAVQHLRWYREDQINELYEELDDTTRLFKERINKKETLVLIVSDHGQKKGLHTPHGFYSCSEKLNLKNPKITDFADIIRKKLGVPSKRDIEKIKERLRRLGYT